MLANSHSHIARVPESGAGQLSSGVRGCSLDISPSAAAVIAYEDCKSGVAWFKAGAATELHKRTCSTSDEDFLGRSSHAAGKAESNSVQCKQQTLAAFQLYQMQDRSLASGDGCPSHGIALISGEND